MSQRVSPDIAQGQCYADTCLDISPGVDQTGKFVTHTAITHQWRLNIPGLSKEFAIQIRNGFKKNFQFWWFHKEPFIQ